MGEYEGGKFTIARTLFCHLLSPFLSNQKEKKIFKLSFPYPSFPHFSNKARSLNTPKIPVRNLSAVIRSFGPSSYGVLLLASKWWDRVSELVEVFVSWSKTLEFSKMKSTLSYYCGALLLASKWWDWVLGLIEVFVSWSRHLSYQKWDRTNDTWSPFLDVSRSTIIARLHVS